MRLGTETNSLVNHLMSGTKGQPLPEAGMGITLLHWTDRRAGTITRVENFKSGPRKGQPRSLWFREDHAIRTDNNGMSESQEYRYEPNPEAIEWEARETKRGWVACKTGTRIALGYRRAYHDYSF